MDAPAPYDSLHQRTEGRHPVFANAAPAYFDKGLSPLPLNGKVPVIAKWQSYCDNVPKGETRAEWLLNYPTANIGLALGKEVVPGFRLGVLDVDEDRFVPVVAAVLKSEGPAKIGKKGKSFFVLFEKRPDFKSTKLMSATGTGAVDVLIASAQTVLPPSIHPDTRTPYFWVGPPLLEWTLESLPRVSKERLQFLKMLISSEEAAQLATGKSTHNAGLRLTATMIRFIDSDDEIIAIFQALLPKGYAGDSLRELPGWIKSAREKGFDRVGKAPMDETAALIVEKELAPLKYTVRDGFLHYEGGRWKSVPRNSVRRELKAQLTPMIGPKGQVSGVISGAEHCLALNVEDENFGQPEGKICLGNGTLDLIAGELIPHSPEHRLRFALDIDWDPSAQCAIYEEQLRATLRNDQKAIDTFEEFAGLTLVSDLNFHKALYLQGEGGSGKSTLLKTIEWMHDPSAVSVTPLDKIDDERYRTDLVGKLVCITYDVQTDQKVFRETFIRITGGDPVAVRRLFKEVDGLVQPTVRFIGSMNPDMPAFVGAPDALRRRLIFLLCGGRIENPDPLRQEKIKSERAGILVRWVNALKRLYARGRFDPPESSKIEVEDYLSAYEPFDGFAAEKLTKTKGDTVPVSEVTRSFNDWADLAGERHLTANVIGRKLRRLGFEVGQRKMRTGGRMVNTRVVFAKWSSAVDTPRPLSQRF